MRMSTTFLFQNLTNFSANSLTFEEITHTFIFTCFKGQLINFFLKMKYTSSGNPQPDYIYSLDSEDSEPENVVGSKRGSYAYTMINSGSDRFSQCCLISVGALAMISGIVIISVGAYVQTTYHKYEPILDESFFSVPALLIATGSIILVISFFGCCGAVTENHCMTIMFSVFLVIIFILELAAGIAGYVLRNKVDDVLLTQLNKTMTSYTNNTEFTVLWDGIQKEFKCCGLQNYTSWNEVFHNDSLPISCCSPGPGTIGSMECTNNSTDNVYKDGCLDKMENFVVHNAVILGGVGVGIAVIQFLGIILSCSLARSIRKHYQSV